MNKNDYHELNDVNVKYDIPLPNIMYGKSDFCDIIIDFYNSEHSTMMIEYNSKYRCSEVLGLYKKWIDRLKIDNVRVLSRNGVCYLYKTGEVDNIPNPHIYDNLAVEELKQYGII